MIKKTTYEQARGKRIRSYGLTLEEHEQLMSDQGGKCWICQGDNGLKALCIDHDHKTNNVRGLLCNLCNRAIGLLRDDPELIDKAAEYIRKGSPEHLQGKLIGKHGRKVRVPLDYVEPEPEPCVEDHDATWKWIADNTFFQYHGHTRSECNCIPVYNRKGILMRYKKVELSTEVIHRV